MSESGRPAVGDRLELTAGPVAHGGHVVARQEGLVVFVRHALPGEQLVARVTEDDGRFLRADAVEVLVPSPDRVRPPCPYAGPGRCGGCDFQHAALAAQRRMKAAVVEEQLRRLAGLEQEVDVEAVPGPGTDGLAWRSRMQFIDLGEGRKGLRRHRSHDVVEIDRCLIEAPGAVRTWAGSRSKGTVTEVVGTRPGHREFAVAADGFWQPHRDAPRVLVEAVLELAAVRPGERVLDLYAGVGLFSAFLAEAVGGEGGVVSVEGDRTASRLAGRNLADLPQVEVLHGPVDRVLRRDAGPAHVVVLDPPRVGARRKIVGQIAGLRPRAVVYVACDPAALARDVGYFATAGYRLQRLRAFDLFPMTHHVECVALLEKTGSDLR